MISLCSIFSIDFVIWRFYSKFSVLDDYALSGIPNWWIPPKWNSTYMKGIEFQTSKSCAHKIEVIVIEKPCHTPSNSLCCANAILLLLFFGLFTFACDKWRYGFFCICDCNCDWKLKSIFTSELMQFVIIQRLYSLESSDVKMQQKSNIEEIHNAL